MGRALGAYQVSGADLGAYEAGAVVSYTPDLTSDGWTTIPEPVTGRKVYVSTSGSDSNDGLSDGAPKATLAAGLALIREGFDDHLLLNRGDTWAESITHGLSGASASAPIVFATYGSGARPKVEGFVVQGGGGRVYPSSNWRLHDWHFSRSSRGTPINLLLGGSDIRIEGIYVDDTCSFGINLAGIDGDWDNVNIYRCVIGNVYDAADAGHHQGIFADQCNNLTIEECYFDKCGWSATDAADIFKHNIYIQNSCSNVVARKLFVSRASANGIQMRTGGILEDTFFYQNPIAALVHDDGNGEQSYARRNVVIDGADVDASARGWGFDVKGQTIGCDVDYNIFANQVTGTGDVALVLGDTAQSAPEPVDLRVRNNIIYKWGGTSYLESLTSGAVLSDNDIQMYDGSACFDMQDAADIAEFAASGNRFYSSGGTLLKINSVAKTLAGWETDTGDTTSTEAQVSYTAGDNNLNSYAASVSLADTAALLSLILDQRKGNWDLNLTPDRINAYFRANFDMIPAPSSFTATKDSLDVDLEWDAIPEASGYIIERRTDGGSWEQIGSA